jgi:hypothetical protein
MQRHKFSKARFVVSGALVVMLLCSVGCQIDVGGQTLPSPYYLTDDVQYFPAGPEFKLSEEAAAMRIYAAEEELGQLDRAVP